MSTDAFYTPVSLGSAILKAFSPYLPVDPKQCWEPCAGGDNLAEAIRNMYPSTYITGTDISDVDSRDICDERSITDCRKTQPDSTELIFTNPPFSAHNNEAYKLSSSVCHALINYAIAQKCPLLLLAPASWYLGAERWAWLRHGPLACSTTAAIIKRPWKGQREVAVYGWNLQGAPHIIPDIRWVNDGSAPDRTCGNI